jgi:hypothetical protein
MKIELDAAKNTAIAVYNCAVTLRGTEQRTQEKRRGCSRRPRSTSML